MGSKKKITLNDVAAAYRAASDRKPKVREVVVEDEPGKLKKPEQLEEFVVRNNPHLKKK